VEKEGTVGRSRSIKDAEVSKEEDTVPTIALSERKVEVRKEEGEEEDCLEYLNTIEIDDSGEGGQFSAFSAGQQASLP